MGEYILTYRDMQGTEETICRSNSSELTFTLRGKVYSGEIALIRMIGVTRTESIGFWDWEYRILGQRT